MKKKNAMEILMKKGKRKLFLQRQSFSFVQDKQITSIENDKIILNALHLKLSFPLRISSVNVTKSLMVNIFCAVKTVMLLSI